VENAPIAAFLQDRLEQGSLLTVQICVDVFEEVLEPVDTLFREGNDPNWVSVSRTLERWNAVEDLCQDRLIETDNVESGDVVNVTVRRLTLGGIPDRTEFRSQICLFGCDSLRVLGA
jgi:hypothetical protein